METNYWEVDTTDPEDEIWFPCACGDSECIGNGNDPKNINVQGTWYAADCPIGAVRKAFEYGDIEEAR